MRWWSRANGAAPREDGRPSFDEVVLPHLDAAYNLARWLVRDRHLAEDVVQDAVLRGLTYFGSFRGGDARAWFLRIVRNTAYTTLAARQATLRHVDGQDAAAHADALDVPDPAAGPEAALSSAQDSECLARALAELPAELRECLVLKELEELSYREIARITGVPIGTVMSRLWRARQRLLGSAIAGGAGEP